jgi:peptidyl-prolyl cis-trans isomerase SurA
MSQRGFLQGPAKRNVLVAICASVAAVFILSHATSQAEVIDRIVAKINQEIITLHDLKRSSGPYLFAFGIDPNQIDERPDADKIYNQVLQDMINTRLLIQEARTLKINISDDEVNRWVGNIHGRMNISEDQFKTTLRGKGIRWSDYRRYVHENLLKVRVIQIRISSRIKITDEEVLRAYKETYGEDPEEAGIKTMDLSHIYISYPENPSEDDKVKIRKIIENSHKRVTEGKEDFKAVAKEVSLGHTASEGGYLGSYQRGDLGKEIESVLFDQAEGEITEPIEVSKGFHIFKVHRVSVERDPNIQDKLEKLRGSLREEELNRELDTWVQNLREKAYVRVLF